MPGANWHAAAIMQVDWNLGILQDQSFASPIGELETQAMDHIASTVEDVGGDHLLRKSRDDVVAGLDFHGNRRVCHSMAAGSMAVHGAVPCDWVAGPAQATAHEGEKFGGRTLGVQGTRNQGLSLASGRILILWGAANQVKWMPYEADLALECCEATRAFSRQSVSDPWGDMRLKAER